MTTAAALTEDTGGITHREWTEKRIAVELVNRRFEAAQAYSKEYARLYGNAALKVLQARLIAELDLEPTTKL